MTLTKLTEEDLNELEVWLSERKNLLFVGGYYTDALSVVHEVREWRRQDLIVKKEGKSAEETRTETSSPDISPPKP